MSFIPFFLQDAAANGAAGSSSFGMLIPLVLIVIIMYFFMIRPQNKKQKETEKMLAALKKGDKVVTIGGIHGTIASTKDNTVVVKVDDNTKIEFNRSAIATVITDKPAEAPAEEKKSLFGRKKKAEKTEAAPAKEEAPAENTESASEEKKDE